MQIIVEGTSLGNELVVLQILEIIEVVYEDFIFLELLIEILTLLFCLFQVRVKEFVTFLLIFMEEHV